MLTFTRRALMGQAVTAGAALAGTTMGLDAAFAAGSGQLMGGAGEPVPRVDDPLRATLRMNATLTPGRDVPWYYTGTVLGVTPEEGTQRLFRFEGTEMYRVHRLGEDRYRLGGSTVTFFRDIETGALLEEMVNPYTGETVPVKPNVLGGPQAQGIELTPAGQRWIGIEEDYTDHPLDLFVSGDWIWWQHFRHYPPGTPPLLWEQSSTMVSRTDFENADLDSLPATFASAFIAPFPTWMGMGERPGHVIWHAFGRKLAAIEDAPADYLARLRRDFPDRLTLDPAE